MLEFIFPPQCGGCRKTGTGMCERCLPRPAIRNFALTTLNVDVLAAYEGRVRRAVLALKTGRRDVAEAFADRLSELVSARDILVPVPTTAARRRERGFDGCNLMARRISTQVGAHAECGLVQIAGDRQRGRNRDSRLAARGRFAWRGRDLSGVRVTLLDDVVTTGATLEDCAAVLRTAGARVERAIAIARA
ncbi:MAG TPA: hypothetical protein VGZ02_09585 [Candidatus Baltobacteraceae bacterium]|nr:hypothetical protein [Candidatus Baltobacteraceae bacterium]